MYILIGIIWLVLGIHSALFLERRIELHNLFNHKRGFKHNTAFSTNIMIVACILLPIASHIATMIAYPNKKL